ncbi:MAG: TetR family transcriptional regulator, partial [bacterium]|nr:TetR family transcriptional regulator [bacterium]
MPRLSRAAAAALTAEDMVDAAMTVLITEGLDNVNMRRVAAELGVSPIPLYNRIGNKDALLDAMAARIGSEFFLPVGEYEHWTDYARRGIEDGSGYRHQSRGSTPEPGIEPRPYTPGI